jgi:hypothetical protein
MNTNLKDFELQLQRLINMETDIDTLKECRENAGTSFDADTTECKNFNNNDYNDLSYNAIYKMMQVVVYTSSSNYSVFEQDFTDLSGNPSTSTGGVQGILANKHVLPAQYKQVKELRNDLDNKMRDILNQGETDITRMHDSDVYMTFGWTLLATSVLYYLFSKL